MATDKLSIALDHNFPEPVLNALDGFVPEACLLPIRKIHPKLPDLDDHELVVALRQLDIGVLATNDYKMFKNPRELAAIMSTRLTVIAFEGLGDDPIRAAGALLLDLPTITNRIEREKAQLFWLRPKRPEPIDPWNQLQKLAERRNTTARLLYEECRLSESDLSRDHLATPA